jgi:hypothetical protein
MNRSFQLSREERHLAKLADLDALEQMAVNSDNDIDIASAYERIFEALDNRPNTSTETILDWGQRYIAWATSFTERDGFPFMTAGWAKRLFERAMTAQRLDIARRVADAILCSYAPLERERQWWQKQHYALTHNECA